MLIKLTKDFNTGDVCIKKGTSATVVWLSRIKFDREGVTGLKLGEMAVYDFNILTKLSFETI